MNALVKSLSDKGKRVVVGEGPTNAKLVLVGEALGEMEEYKGRPFVGPAGYLLDGILNSIGIRREEVYITNVIPIRPRDNKLENLKELGLSVSDFLPFLKEQLELIRPNCIVALGKTAMQALCNLDEISDWRGSILSSSLLPGVKVVPTFHPSFINRMGDKTAKEEIEKSGSTGVVYDYGTAKVCLALDLRRGKEESKSADFYPECFDFSVVRTAAGVRDFITNALSFPELSFDIETVGNRIVSIAFSFDGQFGYTIPLEEGELHGSREETFYELGKLFSTHTGLIAQNGIFDITMLLQHFPTKLLHFDTMVAHHSIYPELPHSLAFLSSVYTRFPFYKWMRKGHVTKEEFYRYNSLDAVATFQVARKLKDELEFYELKDFFHGFVMPLWHCLFRMSLRGIKVDKIALEELDKTLEKEVGVDQVRLNEMTGQELNVRSFKQLKDFFYEQKKMVVQRKRKTGAVTLDEDALEKLAKKSPEAKQVLVIREKENLRSKLTRMTLDFDQRARTTYSQSVTDTGRLSSKKTFFHTGLNLQNVPKEPEKRKFFVADNGNLLGKVDLSQSEARLVIWFANDAEGKIFLHNGGDIHTWGASIVLQALKKNVEMTKLIRDGCKPIVHGLNYLLGSLTLIDIVRENLGFVMTKKEADYVRNFYLDKRHAIKTWHKEIHNVMDTTRTLVNPYGRRRTFFGRYGDDLHRKMVAHLPQSTNVDHLDSALNRIDLRFPDGAEVLLQVHDEIVWQFRPELQEETIQIVREELALPITIHGDSLIIPVEIKVGPNWGDMKNV